MNTNKRVNEKGLSWKQLLRMALFVILFAAILLELSRVMTVDTESYDYSLIRTLYEEEEGALDGVYIGSSNCYAYWNSLVAFEEYGITVLPFASSSQPLAAAEYMIREARKTQPDALYIVNINTAYESGASDAAIHKLLDYMPFSREKMELTAYILDYVDIPVEERIEYYFPLIRYHSRWDELTPSYFQDMSAYHKNCLSTKNYFKRIEDISEDYVITKEVADIEDKLEDCLESLLDYCDGEQVDVIFVTVPQQKDEDIVQRYNRINEIIAARGYPVLDLLSNLELTNIDPKIDFYNDHHTNVHGSLKFTHYLSQYMLENYGFTDKREDPRYTSWHTSLEAYDAMLDDYVLDFERMRGSRDYSLEAVSNLQAVADQDQVTISWEAVEGADGYALYRYDNKQWQQFRTTEECQFLDMNVDAGLRYYNVVPYSENNGVLRYGGFSYVDISVEVRGKGE